MADREMVLFLSDSVHLVCDRGFSSISVPMAAEVRTYSSHTREGYRGRGDNEVHSGLWRLVSMVAVIIIRMVALVSVLLVNAFDCLKALLFFLTA